MAQMTKEVLVEACKKNGGYSQPRLNDQLFLQYRGFQRIENLDEYVELKVLWLEQNAIETIEGLSNLKELCSLFLQNNAIRRIDGLGGLQNLRILNLSNNFLTTLENLRCCPLLETLQVSHCRLSSLRGLEEAVGLPHLSTLDVSFNKIEREPAVDVQDTFLVDFFRRFAALSVLYLHGNDITRSVKDYRKQLIVGLPGLQYLDERPVFPDERRVTEAWGRGGREAEDAERDLIREEKRAHMSSCVEDMIKLKERTKDARDASEKEWRERQAAKKRWADEQRMNATRLLNETDAEEFEGRAVVEEVELSERAALTQRLTFEWEVGAAEEQRMREEMAVRQQAAKELQEEEEAMLAAQSSRRAAEDAERQVWLKRFTDEDDAVEDELQRDLDRFLSGLTPGAAAAPLLSRPALTNMPSKGNTAATAATSAPPPSAAATISKETTTSPSFECAPARVEKKGLGSAEKKKLGNSRVWEQYYAFESAANRRFLAARK